MCTYLSFPVPRVWRRDLPLQHRYPLAWTVAGAYLEAVIKYLWTALFKNNSLSKVIFSYDKIPTTRKFVLPHSGLYHVGFNGTANAYFVIICDDAVSPVLLVQKGVGWLRALWSFANAWEGVCSLLTVERNKYSFIYLSQHNMPKHGAEYHN